MNCLEYRRSLGSEPRRESATMSAHRAECPRCAEHQARSLGFELQLKRALNVPVPDGLAERILLAQTTEQRRERGDQRRRWGLGLAAAASLALAVGAGSFWIGGSANAFPTLMVEHLSHEPAAFATQTALADEAVQANFKLRGVTLQAALPSGISYVQPCPIGPYKTVHMVMPEATGPVTVIYVANHREAQRDDFRRGDMQGRSVPMGQGTLVMVARDGRSFDGLEQSWRRSIEGQPSLAALYR